MRVEIFIYQFVLNNKKIMGINTNTPNEMVIRKWNEAGATATRIVQSGKPFVLDVDMQESYNATIFMDYRGTRPTIFTYFHLAPARDTILISPYVFKFTEAKGMSARQCRYLCFPANRVPSAELSSVWLPLNSGFHIQN